MKVLILILTALSLTPQPPSKGNILCNINNDKIREFVSRHWDGSLELYQTRGIPMAVSLSQWILESGYGTAPVAINRKNLGGLMAYSGGVKYLARFASYKAFYKAYGRVFERDCYKSLQPHTLPEWLHSLEWECCSYARSKEYKSKLERIITRYGFDELPL